MAQQQSIKDMELRERLRGSQLATTMTTTTMVSFETATMMMRAKRGVAGVLAIAGLSDTTAQPCRPRWRTRPRCAAAVT